MATLQTMPAIALLPAQLAALGVHWNTAANVLPKAQGEALGSLCDNAVGTAIATMLGGIPILAPINKKSLLPPQPDCVEVGHSRVIGGIRPQNFDVIYRPDGVRFAYDSKTLNARNSLGKNYRNMINDLGTEAATVHTRYPSAIVAFIVAVPEPCLGNHTWNLINVLRRLSGRQATSDEAYKAEAISLVIWDPLTGVIDGAVPAADSNLRIEKFSIHVESCYVDRFAGLPPHSK